jgi:hypothetical protein
MRFQRRRFLEIDQSETRIFCGGMFFLANWAEVSTLYKGLFIDASYQVSENLFLINQTETRIACGSHVC